MNWFKVLLLVILSVFLGKNDSYSLSLSDVTLNDINADAYYGPIYKSKDDQNPNLSLSDINTIKNDPWTWSSSNNAVNGSGFSFIESSDSGSTSALGYTFNLVVNSLAVSDTFTLSVTGALPANFDFIFVLKTSTGVALYYFDDYLISDYSNNGTYTIAFLNASRKNYGTLSHIDVYGRLGDPIPEPTTMLLFGTGIAGFAGIARRKRD